MVLITSQIQYNPQPEDVGTIRVSVSIAKIYQSRDLLEEDIYEELVIYTSRHSIFSLSYLCVELMQILMDSGITTLRDACDVIIELLQLVGDITCSADYTSDCALSMSTNLTIFLSCDEELSAYVFDTLEEIEQEVIRLSLDDTNSIRSRPASKLVVGSLSRNIYNKSSNIVGEIDTCTICLEEFNDGTRVVTLPCGHEFDDECVVKWFESSHVCPLCRFELPCEDEIREIEN